MLPERETKQPENRPSEPQTPAFHSDAGGLTRAVGHWIHEHPDFTDKNPVGYTGYQYVRSALAAVPYGVSMASTWLGFEKLAQAGEKLAGGKLAEFAIPPAGAKAAFGYRLAEFTRSPAVRTSAMIATSFSLYRGTSKVGKWANEHLFNHQDSEEQTVEKVKNLPKEAWNKWLDAMPAEIHSTPVAAIVLGFIVSTFDAGKIPEALRATPANMAKARAEGRGLEFFFKDVLANPKSRFFEHAAINSIGYSLFFELGDRRNKDYRISQGQWKGDAYSIGANSRSSPSIGDLPEEGVKQPDTLIQASPHAKDFLAPLTREPSTLRFFNRRVIPTAIGITGYTAFKFRGAPMILGPMAEGLTGLKDLPRASWREGAATSLFFMIPFVTDKYVKWHDQLVNHLEDVISGKKEAEPAPIPEERRPVIEKNFRDLQDKLREKDQGLGVPIA